MRSTQLPVVVGVESRGRGEEGVRSGSEGPLEEKKMEGIAKWGGKGHQRADAK